MKIIRATLTKILRNNGLQQRVLNFVLRGSRLWGSSR